MSHVMSIVQGNSVTNERLPERVRCRPISLQPRIGKAIKSIPREKEISADRRNITAVQFSSDSQVAKCGWRQFPDGRKQLGSSSEVEHVRVQSLDSWWDKARKMASRTWSRYVPTSSARNLRTR